MLPSCAPPCPDPTIIDLAPRPQVPQDIVLSRTFRQHPPESRGQFATRHHSLQTHYTFAAACVATREYYRLSLRDPEIFFGYTSLTGRPPNHRPSLSRLRNAFMKRLPPAVHRRWHVTIPPSLVRIRYSCRGRKRFGALPKPSAIPAFG